MITVSDKSDAVAARQLLASIGQVKLINTYSALFGAFNMLCSQVLVTKEDFRDRLHYLNMRNCLEVVLQHQVIPVVNENDVVSVTELMFTDNDELAGLIASLPETEQYRKKVPAMRRRLDHSIARLEIRSASRRVEAR